MPTGAGRMMRPLCAGRGASWLRPSYRGRLGASGAAGGSSAAPGATANWLARGRLQHGLRAYGTWPLHRPLAPPERFAILTAGRAGSELLVSLLDSHPQIVCDGELLSIRRVAPWALIDSRAALAGLRGARAHGFKLLRNHLLLQGPPEPAERLAELHRRGHRLISLERRNLLAQAVSYLIAAEIGYHHRRGDARSFEPIAVDPMALIAMLVALEELRDFAREALSRLPHLELVYEDDLLDGERQQATVARICAWLSIEPRPVASQLVKITPDTICGQVSNYAALVDTLACTRFARYLDEVQAGVGSST